MNETIKRNKLARPMQLDSPLCSAASIREIIADIYKCITMRGHESCYTALTRAQ